MQDNNKRAPGLGDPEQRRLKRYTCLLITATTAVLAASLIWNIAQERRNTRRIARAEARAYFYKDQAFRTWATMHGGVYVPVTDATQPNPYLTHVPDRDIEHPAGYTLTLMNPAYVVRQMNEATSGLTSALGRITSLKPLRPGNAADAWERKALQALEQGQAEVLEYTEWQGEPALRLMRPMVTQRGCLKCHEHQGYQEGDIRGGVAVTLPMGQLVGLAQGHNAVLFVCHTALWLLIVLGIGLGARRINRDINQKRQAEKKTRESEEKYHQLFDAMLDGYALHEIICNDQGRPVDYRFLEVNPSFERLTGLTRDKILGKTVLEVLPGTESYWIESYGKVALTGEPDRFENFSCQLDRHYEIVAFSPQGGQFACIFQDVTQRKQAELTLKNAHDEMERHVALRTAELAEANRKLEAEVEQRRLAGLELAQSESRYRLLIETMTEGLGQLDAQGRISYVNPKLCQMLGYSEQELLGTQVGQYLDSKNQAILVDQFAKRRQRKASPYEIEWTRKDGSNLCTLVSPRASYHQGQYVGSLGVITDVTPLKKTEQALRLSEERFAKAFHCAPLLIGISCLEDGTYLEVNRTFVEKTGFSYEEAVGKTSLELGLLDTEARQHLMDALEKDGCIRDTEVSVRAKDGSRMDCLFAAEKIQLEDQLCLIAVVQDITERKRAEKALLELNASLRLQEENLRKERDKARKFFDIAGTMLTVIGPDQRVRLINRRGCEILGLPQEEIVGTNWFDRFLPAQLRDEVKQVFSALVKGDIEPVEFYENPVLTADGQERIIAWHNTTLTDEEGNFLAVLGSGEDITEEKQAQAEILKHREQLRSLASKLSATEESVRKKAAATLHDSIGQSLVSCRLLLGAEKQGDLSSDLNATLDQVIDILERVTNETKELTFDLASPTLYKLGLIPALEEWLTETIRAQYGIRTCLKHKTIPGALDETVSVMAFRCIREITFNAVKHAQAHHIEVHVEMTEGQLLARIVDDGIGFDYEQIETDAIHQGHFGLLSVRERLQYMGGQFQVHSSPECGTKVVLSIPVPIDILTEDKETADDRDTHTLSR